MHESSLERGEFSRPEELMGKAEWHHEFNYQLEKSVENGEPLSVIFIDINSFKAVNDTFGHVTGDEVIEDIGNVIGFVAQNLRLEDDNVEGREPDTVAFHTQPPHRNPSAASIGGDEFAILAKTDEAGATALINRLRSAFTAYIEQDEQAPLRSLGLGLAVGSATFEPGKSGEDLLREADEKMYEDKHKQIPKLTEEQKALLGAVAVSLQDSGLDMRHIAYYLTSDELPNSIAE